MHVPDQYVYWCDNIQLIFVLLSNVHIPDQYVYRCDNIHLFFVLLYSVVGNRVRAH